MSFYGKLAQKNKKKHPKTVEAYRKHETAKQIENNYTLSQEIGILGDAVEYLFDLISKLREDVVISPAFEHWRDTIKAVKQNIAMEYKANE
jgi:cation transport regulator ChaC